MDVASTTAGDAAGRDRPDSAGTAETPSLPAPGKNPRPPPGAPAAPQAAPGGSAAQAGGTGRPGWRSRLRATTDRAGVPGLIAFLAALAAIEGRLILLDHNTITELLRIGTVYGNPARVPHGVFVLRRSTGYDGQFYYRLALDPANLHKTAFGITMDAPYRFMRIGYSALAWLVSLGHYTAVPYALAAINVAALAALGYLGGLLAREAGRHAIWGLLLVATSA